VTEINLSYIVTIKTACVFNRKRQLRDAIGGYLFRGQLAPLIFERCITQTMPKRIEGLALKVLISPIFHRIVSKVR